MRRRTTWNEIRKRHPERMARHLEALNTIHREVARHRENRLTALLPIIPKGPRPSWELRDQLAEAWEEVYGEELDSRKAWLEVRFGIRRGVFIMLPDGLYDTMSRNGDQGEAGGGVG